MFLEQRSCFGPLCGAGSGQQKLQEVLGLALAPTALGTLVKSPATHWMPLPCTARCWAAPSRVRALMLGGGRLLQAGKWGNSQNKEDPRLGGEMGLAELFKVFLC